MKRICFLLMIMIMMLLGVNAFSESLPIRYFQTDYRYEYRIELLKIALNNTLESDGPFSLEPVSMKMTQGRGLLSLERGENMDIAFLPTNREREARFLPVRIPILKGILGYRVFLIHKDNMKKFLKIKTFEQLKAKFKAGFANHWADMKILKFNEIPVVGTAKYGNLFHMLSKKRFDYFPRGINEAWKEIKERKVKNPELMVDLHNAVYYPYPVYYFVNKKNLKLADRIERGLKIALKDGTFKKLFLKYHAPVIKQAKLDGRNLFIIKNPTLPAGTPDPDTSWWLDKK